MNKTMIVVKKAAGRAAGRPVIPTTMKAAVLTGFGGKDKIQLRLVPVPKVGPHEVLIHLVAAGLGSWDARLRRGDWPGEVKPPVILGADGSGVIIAKGSRVRGLEVGDEVYACRYMNPKGGFHAEYVCVSEDCVGPKPSKLSLERAGAIATTGLTAMQGVERLDLKKGGVVLVFGATGGVGTMAVQFAKFKGASVIGTGVGKGLEYIHSIGLDAGFDPYKEGKKGFEKALDAVGAGALDAILATAGGDLLQELVERVRPGGKVVFPNGVEPEPRAFDGVKVEGYDGVPSRKALEDLTRLVEQIPYFDAPIERIFPLDKAADAHMRMDAGDVVGKVVLQTDPMWPVLYTRAAADKAVAAQKRAGRRRH